MARVEKTNVVDYSEINPHDPLPLITDRISFYSDRIKKNAILLNRLKSKLPKTGQEFHSMAMVERVPMLLDIRVVEGLIKADQMVLDFLNRELRSAVKF